MKLIKNKLAVTIIVLSVTFLILIGSSFKRDKISMVENGAGITINLIQGNLYKANSKIKEFLYFIINYGDIKKRNESLIRENNKLKNKAEDYDDLKAENERLREMFNFKTENENYNYIGCDIVGKSGGAYLDELVVNKGARDGVEKQMVVITSAGLVGQVISVGSNWAKVQTLSNENMAVSAIVQNTRENVGVVKGYKDSKNRQLAKLYYLPLESKIKKEDIILTSGIGNSGVGGLYPKGIKIGYVVDVEEDKGKVMKNAVIRPYVNFSKLEEVYIIIPKDKLYMER